MPRETENRSWLWQLTIFQTAAGRSQSGQQRVAPAGCSRCSAGSRSAASRSARPAPAWSPAAGEGASYRGQAGRQSLPPRPLQPSAVSDIPPQQSWQHSIHLNRSIEKTKTRYECENDKQPAKKVVSGTVARFCHDICGNPSPPPAPGPRRGEETPGTLARPAERKIAAM